MLIELHESIAEAPQDDAHRNALDALGRCDAHGYHLVVALPGVTRRIVARHSPTGLAAKAFYRIGANETGWAQLTDALEVTLRVEAGLDEPTWEGQSGNGILRVPILYCAKTGFENPSVLVGEHLNDAKLYLNVGRAFVAGQRLQGVRVCVECDHGGGGTTPTVYADRQGQPPPCLAVVDGDHRYPNGPIGEVARGVRSADDSDVPHTTWLALPVRAAENVLPHGLLNDIAGGDPNVATVLLQHEAIQADSLSELLNVCDLRSGTPYYEAFVQHSDPNRRSFWSGILPAIMALRAIPEPRNECNGVCEADNRSECECPMVMGYGPILGRSIVAIEQRTSHKTWECVDPRTLETWKIVGSKVAAWGAARTPLQS